MELFIATTATFSESLEHITGFISVIITLVILWFITAMMGKAFIRSEVKKQLPDAIAKANRDAPAKSSAVSSQKTDTTESTEEEIAAVCAAVTFIMGAPSRVISMKSSNPDWSREGRRDHFASHRIR